MKESTSEEVKKKTSWQIKFFIINSASSHSLPFSSAASCWLRFPEAHSNWEESLHDHCPSLCRTANESVKRTIKIEKIKKFFPPNVQQWSRWWWWRRRRRRPDAYRHKEISERMSAKWEEKMICQRLFCFARHFWNYKLVWSFLLRQLLSKLSHTIRLSHQYFIEQVLNVSSSHNRSLTKVLLPFLPPSISFFFRRFAVVTIQGKIIGGRLSTVSLCTCWRLHDDYTTHTQIHSHHFYQSTSRNSYTST